MLAHKHITKIVAAVMAAAVGLCLCAVAFSGPLTAWAGDKGIAQEYETALFDTSSILSVNIQMDEADWNDMLENATAETYYQCNVEVNGTMFYQVGIRPKGNTSLSAIANDDTTDRYSFKLEFDHYVDGQTCFGLDKLILNNNYADATNLKEALIYDMYQYLGADASLYNYAKISVNGEYWGVYLALEGVEDSFQLRNYGTESFINRRAWTWAARISKTGRMGCRRARRKTSVMGDHRTRRTRQTPQKTPNPASVRRVTPSRRAAWTGTAAAQTSTTPTMTWTAMRRSGTGRSPRRTRPTTSGWSRP